MENQNYHYQSADLGLILLFPLTIFFVLFIGIGLKEGFLPLWVAPVIVLIALLLYLNWITNRITLAKDYLLIKKSLMFWQPKFRFDLKKIACVTLDTTEFSKKKFKIVIHLNDGREFAYIVRAKLEKVERYFEEKRLENDFKVYKLSKLDT